MRTAFPFTLHLEHRPQLDYPGPWIINLNDKGQIAYAGKHPQMLSAPQFTPYFVRLVLR